MQRTFNKALRKPYFRNGSKGLNTTPLWTPSVLSTALWLDGSDSSTITISTGVSEWRDKSGNGNHLSQATGANQPSYANNTVEFSSTKSLARSSNQILSGATSGSVYFIGLQPIYSVGGWGRFGGTAGAYTDLHTPYSDGTFYESFMSNGRYQIGSGVTHPLPTSIINFNNSGTNLSIRRNASDVGNANITFEVPATGNQFLGGMVGAFAIKELVMLKSVLSQSDREKMEGYLAWKWDLVSVLPASHPYKNTPPRI